MPTPTTIAAALLGASLSLPALAQSPAQAAVPGSADRAAVEHAADSLFAAKDYRRALTLFDRLTRIDSAAPRYWFRLGMSAAQVMDYETGARAFARANALGGSPVASYNTGAMHARLGHADSAFVWLGRAVQAGFSDTATFAADDDLASLRSDARFGKLRLAMAQVPSPCKDDPNYRRFDFWVGTWRVTAPDGTPAGSSHVDVISGGCALLENWRALRGSEGKSINTYDPATHQWRQFWVGQGGAVTDYRESEWHDTSVSFLVRSPAANGGRETILRLTFTPLDSDLVRQHAEASTDGGKTWTTQYDLRYHRMQ